MRLARVASARASAVATITVLAVAIGMFVPVANVAAGPGDAPLLTGALSRKAHGAAGTFDLPLAPTPANPTTEPRLGPAQTVVFVFDKPVTSGTAFVTEGTATIGAVTFGGNEMIVPLTAVTNMQYVTVAVTNVVAADSGTGGRGWVRVGYLGGDVSQNRAVTLSDLGQVNAQIAQVVTGVNFLKDVNASGTLSLADKGFTNTLVTKVLGAVPTPANAPPQINAGTNQTVTLVAGANLTGSGSDDNQPGPLTFAWTKASGPGAVSFGNPNAVTTSASFGAAGLYVLRLTTSDGVLSNADDVIITVDSGIVPDLLSGDAGASALASLPNADGPAVVPGDIVSHRLLTRLFVVLEPDITVGNFNAAATAIGGTAIATSRTGSRFLTLTVPRQPNIAALNALAQTLDAQPGIAFADAGMEFATAVLPDSAVPGNGSQFDHLMATRFPLAWNAQGRLADCLPRIVPVFVVDKFGPLSFRPSFAGQINPGNFVADSRQVELDPTDPEAGHGYDVSLVLAAKFDSIAPMGAQPFADCIEILQLEMAGQELADVLPRLAERARMLPDQRFVINASNNFPDPLCGANSDQTCTDETLAQMSYFSRGIVLAGRVQRALQWAELAATPSTRFIDRALVVVAAGNKDSASPGFLLVNAYPGFRDANWSSPFALAAHLESIGILATDLALWTSTASAGHPSFALLPADAQALQTDLNTYLGALGSGLHDIIFNTLTVGSATTGAVRTAVAPSTFNFDNARVLAGGEDVVLDSGGDKESGTSFAAPQVAALAGMLWAQSDELRNAPPGDTAQLIRSTATVLPGNGQALTSRVIDAYQAVLNLDVPGGVMAIRRALLDLDDDGDFDDSDLAIFQTQFGLFPGTNINPGLPAFGRYDLNGDGYTGGPRRDWFDLDVTGNVLTGAPQLGTAIQTIEGLEVRYDETAVTDTDVLCFYAYSSLYTGTPDFRRQVLGIDRCLALKLQTTFPASVPAVSTTTLVAHATRLESNSGLEVDASGIFVSILILEGATATPGFGTTGIDGTFGTQVTPKAGATKIRISVEARAVQGGPVLASAEVTATVNAVPTGVVVSPSRAAVGFGKSKVFSALTGTPPFTWSATGGSITQTGIYTAGSVEGEFSVLATSANGGGGVATVIVDPIIGIYRATWERFLPGPHLSGSNQLFSIQRFLVPRSDCSFSDLACYGTPEVDFGAVNLGPCWFLPVAAGSSVLTGHCDPTSTSGGGVFQGTFSASGNTLTWTVQRTSLGTLVESWSFSMTRQ